MSKNWMILLVLGVLLFFLSVQANETMQAATAVDTYELSWFTFDGGGAVNNSGGVYTLGGTIGQPDASFLVGGEYTLYGGFWSSAILYQVYLPLIIR